jgi:hypothetical protein
LTAPSVTIAAYTAATVSFKYGIVHMGYGHNTAYMTSASSSDQILEGQNSVVYDAGSYNTLTAGPVGLSTVYESGANVTIYGGAGQTDVNADYGLHPKNMTFYGGAGQANVYGVHKGVGGAGTTVLLGDNNSTLTSGKGHTIFGNADLGDNITIASFVSGKDYLMLSFPRPDQVTAVMGSGGYANGVETLRVGTGIVSIHTSKPLTDNDLYRSQVPIPS